jgi:hypothetical protein
LPGRVSVHLDRGYDSKATRERLEEERGLRAEISQKGKPAPLQATQRWVVERTIYSWHNAHKKLAWCTERQGRVIAFWVAFSEVIIIVGRLIREAWSHYRWQSLDLLADHDLLAEALSFRSMRLTPPGGIMDVANPPEKNVRWQGEGERLCRQRRTWHWSAVSWRHE